MVIAPCRPPCTSPWNASVPNGNAARCAGPAQQQIAGVEDRKDSTDTTAVARSAGTRQCRSSSVKQAHSMLEGKNSRSPSQTPLAGWLHQAVPADQPMPPSTIAAPIRWLRPRRSRRNSAAPIVLTMVTVDGAITAPCASGAKP